MEGRNYTITIKAESLEKNKSPIATDNPKSEDEKEDKFAAGGVKALRKIFSYGAVKTFATQIVNHEISLVQLRTGSNEMQERASFVNQQIQRGVGLVESAVVGASIGGPVGAVVAIATNLINTLVSYGRRIETLNTKRTIENVSLEMNYVRAGVNGSRR